MEDKTAKVPEVDSKESALKEEIAAVKPVVQADPNIEITALAADVEKVRADAGMTVAEALKKTVAKLRVPKNGKITVNGSIADLGTIVKGGDKIVISPKNKNGLS